MGPRRTARSWTFTLRDGVKFSNGEPFTSADVVYTMDRLRSKKLGSPMADVYANIKSVAATDPTTVTFTLAKVDSEFPASLTDYRDADARARRSQNPAKQAVGTGPVHAQVHLGRRSRDPGQEPELLGQGRATATSCPYLDEIDFIYSPDVAGQVQGLQGGSLDWVGGLSAEQKQTVNAAGQRSRPRSTNTNYCFELQIRCDQKPGSDLALRQAIMAGTDRQAIVDLVAPGVADPGNGTLVGPAYKADYLTHVGAVSTRPRPSSCSPRPATPNGLSIKLVAQNTDPVPAIATAWQAQMKKIGINV